MNQYTMPDDAYTPAEHARFAEIRQALKADGLPDRKTCAVSAAAQLAPLLSAARTRLAIFRPKVCSACGHVFSPAGRVSAHCLDCDHAPTVAHGVAPLPNGRRS